MILCLIPCASAVGAKYAGELFEFPGDARSTAMGGVGVASTHEAATGFYNPALVGSPLRSSLMLAHREQFGGVVNADLVAAALNPLSSDLAIQLGLVRRGVDAIPDTRFALDDKDDDGLLDDDERLIPDSVRYFNQREWGLLLSMAKRNQTGWLLGTNIKLIGHWLADEMGLGLGFDLGVWHRIGKSFSVGLMLQDVTTTQVHWSTGRWETTPPRITCGTGWESTLPIVNLPFYLEGELTGRLDGRRSEQSFNLGRISVLSRAGMEVSLSENLLIRIGGGTLYPLTMGVGLSFPVFSVDYAYVGDTTANVFDPTHQVAMTFYFEALRAFFE